MKNMDNIFKAQEQQREALFEAMKNGTVEEQKDAMNGFFKNMQVTANDYVKEAISDVKEQQYDSKILVDRGIVKQVTNKEKKWLNAVIEKKSFENIDEVMPETMIETVLQRLHREHELIKHVDLKDTKALAKFIFAKPTAATAFWGDICEDIRQMVLEGFKVIEAAANKLSGFVPVCKGLFELGPEFLGAYVIECMYEAMSVQVEMGIIRGAGKGKFEPIGMTMNLTGAVDNVHTKKTAIKLKNLNPDGLAPVMETLSENEVLNGEVIFIVHPSTYWGIVFPALALRNLNAEWVYDRLPTGAKIVKSYAAEKKTAVIGVGKNYFLGVAGKVRIDKYDQTLAIEDMDLFIAKAYMYGQPKDENAFELLDLSAVKPEVYPPGTDNALIVSLQEQVDKLTKEIADLKKAG